MQGTPTTKAGKIQPGGETSINESKPTLIV